MQLSGSFCEPDYLRRLAALLWGVRSVFAALSRQLSLIALPKQCVDINMLQIPESWARQVVFERGLLLRSCPNMFDICHNVEIFGVRSSNRGQLYVAVCSWWVDFKSSSALAMLTQPIIAYNSSRILGRAHVDAEIWKLDICEMCALVLCAF